jgi:hypothetical protein
MLRPTHFVTQRFVRFNVCAIRPCEYPSLARITVCARNWTLLILHIINNATEYYHCMSDNINLYFCTETTNTYVFFRHKLRHAIRVSHAIRHAIAAVWRCLSQKKGCCAPQRLVLSSVELIKWKLYQLLVNGCYTGAKFYEPATFTSRVITILNRWTKFLNTLYYISLETNRKSV